LRHDRIFGYETPLEEWTSDAFFRHVPEEDRESAREIFSAALAEGGSFELDTRILRKDGEMRWVWIQGKVMPDETGQPARLLGSIRDITRRKTVERKLHTQLERMNLLDHITRGIGERQDLRSIFQVVVRSLEDNLPIDFGCICLYNQSTASLKVTCVGV